MKEKTDDIDILEEKEKRALENVKSLLLYSLEHEYFSPFKEEEIDDMNIVLNLVENLISENKELKEEKQELQKYMKECLIPKSIINLVYIPKSKVEELMKELEKEEKLQLKGMKGQDRYSVKQEFMHKINILQSLLGKE